MSVDVNTFLNVCRPKGFGEIIGQDALIATLKGRITHEGSQLGHHLVLAGPSGSGKMTVARMYAQAILCEAKREDGSPCQCCIECTGVLERSSFGYIELDAKKLGDEQHIRDLVGRSDGLKTADWRIFVVDNAECLDAPAADVTLKTLEAVRSTIFIFSVNNIVRFPFAVRSRCQVFQIRPSEREALVDRLREICVWESIVYEDQALGAIARLACGYVGAAFQKLAEVTSHADVTLPGTMKVLGLGWGEPMLQCWQALLDGRAEEAHSCFERVASDNEGRIRAMQSFLLAMHFRNSTESPHMVEVSVSPALDYLSDENWRSVIQGWQALSRRRSVPVDDLVTDVMNFWSGVRVGSPSSSSFMKGYEVLIGMPKEFTGSANETVGWGADVAT